MYGVTTGFGEFKDEPVPPAQLVELQQNILLSHAAGAGDNADEHDPSNYFAADVVRAALTHMADEHRKEVALTAALDEGLQSPRARPGTWKRVRAAVKRR